MCNALVAGRLADDFRWRRCGMRWRQGFVTAEGSFDAGGPVTSHVFRAEGTQHVFFTSYSDGHIHEYWWKSRPAQHGDLMHASGAPRGVGPIASHVVEAEGTQHVFYQSSDQHIYELWWRSGEAVHVGDLTSASGGPLAAPDLGPLLTGSLASHVFTAEGTQHVFYASGDGQVHELSWSGAARPIYKNLTQRTRRGGPQGDRILISCIDVDRRLEGDLITDPRVDDQCSTWLLLLEI